MVASYENNDPLPVEDPMLLTIRETMVKLDSLKTDQTDMSSKINYLRDIRPRALALLAQADAAEEEANRLEVERATIDKEIERLRSVVNRMEDMRYSTKQLTDQMHLDTALQMRHILENGKSIVPRADSPTSAALANPTTSGSPATSSSMSKYSPSRQLSLTPGSSGVANYAALAASEAAVSRQSLAGGQQPFVDVPPLPTTAAVAVMPALPVVPVIPAVNGAVSASPGSGRILHNMTPPASLATAAMPSAAFTTTIKSESGLSMVAPTVGYPLVAGVVQTAIPLTSAAMSTAMQSSFPSSVPFTPAAGPPYGSPPVMMYGPPSTVMTNGAASVPASGGGGVGMYPSASTMATALSQKDEDLKSKAQFAGDAEGDEDGRARDALFR
ncbi:hypothetical protein FS837_004331 [Tulasnella sp. UAMH 9824]|nr:hypothetical protein FS837_004331 [Tulasnella sp. UAMH 9824]